MEERTFKITLVDGTSLEGLHLNGNNYISSKKVTEAQFSTENLAKMTIEASDGTVQELENQELVQIQKNGTKYWIVFRQRTEAEIEKDALVKELAAANSAVAELTELVASFMG